MTRPPKKTNGNNNGQARTLETPQAVNAAIKSVCDILRRSNCAGALQYVPELTWLLFLRILDEQEQREAENAEIVGSDFTPSLNEPYRWCDWAAPYDEKGDYPPVTAMGSRRGWLRHDQQNGPLGSFFAFVNGQLLPYLRGLALQPNATPRQKVIGQILTGVERTRIDTERNFAEVLDRLDPIRLATTNPQHVFILSQVYEGLLLRMGEKGNDGGQFFTPRQVIKAMVEVIKPRLGETIYDPSCGTGGFLAQTYQYLHEHEVADNPTITPDVLDRLKHDTFYGREKENLIYPIALANLVVHGIDRPNLWHGNTLTGDVAYDRLFDTAPAQFDVILTNPPFGGKEGVDAQKRFDFKTGATQMLFLQHIIKSLKAGGRCGIVLDEGVLFRTNETRLSSRPSASCWTIVRCGASSACRGASSRRRAPGSRPTCCFSTKVGPRRRFGITICPRRKSPSAKRSPLQTTSPISWNACRSAARAIAVGRSISPPASAKPLQPPRRSKPRPSRKPTRPRNGKPG
jgi:type I restriction enzyme M protein